MERAIQRLGDCLRLGKVDHAWGCMVSFVVLVHPHIIKLVQAELDPTQFRPSYGRAPVAHQYLSWKMATGTQ